MTTTTLTTPTPTAWRSPVRPRPAGPEASGTPREEVAGGAEAWRLRRLESKPMNETRVVEQI